jgi:DNA-3-methyladenine glycosylase
VARSDARRPGGARSDPWSVLATEAYAGRPAKVGPTLLGRYVRRGDVVLRIVEVEAYEGPEDSASHARFGRTARNAPMWGPGGHAYVYLCYGIHRMLNVVTGPEGSAGAVLVRAAEPVAGWTTLRARRGARPERELSSGPGRVGAALGLSRDHSGSSLVEGEVQLLVGEPVTAPWAGPRVGIEYAEDRDRARRWRWADPGSPHVSRPRPPRPG